MKKLLIFSMLPRDCIFEEEAELRSVPITFVRAAILQCEYHCIRSSSAYPAKLRRQQSKQQCPDFPHPIDTPRFFRMIPRCSHPTDTVSPACSGSSLGPPPSGTCLEQPWAESPGSNTCGAFRNDLIRDRVERPLQINNSVNMTSKSLIDDHVFPLNQRARLWEEIYFSWSCDWGRECKILSSDEKGSRGVILVLSGPELHLTYEFLLKAESMKIHAPLITHYPRRNMVIFRAAAVPTYNFWAQVNYIERVFLQLYVLYACASEDLFYSYCRSWVSPWFKGQFKRRAFFVHSLSMLSSAIMLASINTQP